MPRAQVTRAKRTAVAGTLMPLCSSEYEEKLLSVFKAMETEDMPDASTRRSRRTDTTQPKRPLNGFMVFRHGFLRFNEQQKQHQPVVRNRKKAQTMGQQDISRNAGALWNSLKARDSPIAVTCKSIEERWKKQHQQAYPNYQYEPRPSRRSTKSNSRSPSVNARRKSGGKSRRGTRRYESESELAESVSDSEEDEWRPKARSARTAVARSVTSTHSYATESALNSPTSPFILYDLVDDAQAHGSPSLISSDSIPSTSSSIQLPETPAFVPESLPGQSSPEDSYLVSDFIAFTARTGPTHRRSAHVEETTMPVLDDRSLSHDQQLAHIFNGLEAVAMDADWMQAGFAIPNLDDISNSLNLLEPLSYFLKPLQMPQKTPYVGFGHSNLLFTHPITSPTLHLHHFAPNSAFPEATADSIPSTTSNMRQTSAIDVDLLNNAFDS